MSNIQRTNSAIATGSLSDIARQSGQSLAECFITCDAIVIVDTSGSMQMCDVQPGFNSHSRYTEACQQLERLQADLPGKVAVIAFSDHAEFCPSGFPRYIGAGTDMRAALKFIKVADGAGLRLILISDGQPDDAAGTLAVARTFASKIDTIYVGPEIDHGARAFLRELAAATGGTSATGGVEELKTLGSTVRLMIGG